MKVYLSGTIHDTNIQPVYQALVDMGHEVTSHWHLPGYWQADTKQETHESRLAIAEMDREDIRKADIMVAVPCGTHHLRGLHYEIGYAEGLGIPVYVLGTHTDLNTMTVSRNTKYITDLLQLS